MSCASGRACYDEGMRKLSELKWPTAREDLEFLFEANHDMSVEEAICYGFSLMEVGARGLNDPISAREEDIGNAELRRWIEFRRGRT